MDASWHSLIDKVLPLLDKALPVVTFALGLVGSWVTDSLRDNRNYKISRKRASIEFQTTNYLALQSALQEMGRSAGKVLQYEKSLVQAHRPIHIGSDEELRASVAKVHVLEERVGNADVRSTVRIARMAAASFGVPDGYNQQTENDFQKAVEWITEAQTVVGQDLRKLMSP